MNITDVIAHLGYEQTFNPLRKLLASARFAHTGGMAHASTSPGLGIDIGRDVLEMYRVK